LHLASHPQFNRSQMSFHSNDLLRWRVENWRNEMSLERLNDVVERLAAAERELERAHSEIKQLKARDRNTMQWRSRGNTIGLLVICAAAGVAMAQSQGSAQTVQAPFVVVGATGRALLEVTDCENISALDALDLARGIKRGNADCLPGMSIYDSDGKPVIRATATRGAGDFMLSSGKSDGTGIFLEASDTRHSISVNDNQKKALLSVDDKEAVVGAPAFQVKADQSLLLEVKKDAITMTGPLSLNNSNGKTVVDIGPNESGRGRVVVRDSASGNVSGLQTDDEGNPFLSLKSNDNNLFSAVSKQGAFIRGPLDIVDSNSKSILKVQDKGGVTDKDGQPTGATNRGLILASSTGNPAAQIYIDGDGNGRVKVHGKGGAVAGLMTTGDGSLLALTDLSGKVTADVSSRVGFATYNASGQRLTEMGATETASYGRLWLGNASGEGIVEAGMLPDGKGTVRAGPAFGARPSSMELPDRIVGHLQ
jgi:hypothetical protein